MNLRTKTLRQQTRLHRAIRKETGVRSRDLMCAMLRLDLREGLWEERRAAMEAGNGAGGDGDWERKRGLELDVDVDGRWKWKWSKGWRRSQLDLGRIRS
eukprot:6887572-Karenia_brevis.AAC.1